jgi:phosphoribosylamine--glycine ligase
MQILIIGSGGREHALCEAIASSPLCTKLYVAPGNPGMAGKAELVPIQILDVEGIVAFCDRTEIDFVVIGPEAPLAAGLSDALMKIGILTFGPSQAAAMLETSKAFTKGICQENDIPTAAAEIFTELQPALEYVRGQAMPIVIKADGLAAGKGVVIAEDLVAAEAAIDDAFSGKFGAAGQILVIEQFLKGEEISFFALCDGKRAIAFGSAQDHKRAFDGDQGPNTGGMGAYSPTPLMTPALEALVMRDIVEPTVAAMAARGTPLRGVLFAGIMICDGLPYLIEYNTRFGDPECEVLLPRLGCDLLPLLMAAAGGNLGGLRPVWKNEAAIAVVMAAQGYPEEYRKGTPIDLSGVAAVPGVTVLHAGTALQDGQLVANGGRVLVVTASGHTLPEAQALAYRGVDAVQWEDGFCRRDIGWRALEKY